MKPYFFTEPDCSGAAVSYVSGVGSELKDQQIQSYVLPENFAVKFYRKGRRSKLETEHNYRYEDTLIPDTSLEIFNWQPGDVRIPLDLSQAFQVLNPSPHEYFASLRRGCVENGEPPEQFFSWSRKHCPHLLRVTDDGGAFIHKGVPVPEGVEDDQTPHDSEYGPETMGRDGEEQQSTPNKNEERHDTVNNNWWISWGYWITFGLILFGGLILTAGIWWVARRNEVLRRLQSVEGRRLQSVEGQRPDRFRRDQRRSSRR